MTLEEQRTRIRGLYASFFAPEDAVRHPLYASLCDIAAQDDTLIDLLLDTPTTQARPNLVLAALHDLALEQPDSDLALHYPTAAHFADCGSSADTGPIEPRPAHPPTVDAAHQVIRWAADHADEVSARMAGRSTQTNEVGRNAVLTAGAFEASGGRALALIDLGCSAGLNLLADRYRIERSDGTVVGDPLSDIIIRSQVSGRPLPQGSPTVAWRAGIDIDPPDLDDDADVRWLLACQWPDDLERFERSRRAMGMWRASTARPPIFMGDAVGTLDAVISQVPDDLLVVVQHSWVATYLPTADQADLAALLRRTMEQRPLAWLSFEHPRLVPGLGHPTTSEPRIPGATTLVLEDHDQGARVIAQAHPHGTWVSWEA